MAEEGLDSVEAGTTFEHVGGKGVSQGVRAAEGEVEFLPGSDHEALDRAHWHGIASGVHAIAEWFAVGVAASGIGKEQERVAVEGPVGAQILDHCGWQRDHAVFVSLAGADKELVFFSENVVDGEAEALGKAQAAAVNKL